jgi:hypothetical protein
MPETTARWTAETIPPALSEILDAQADKVHSPTGAVRSCLADILNAYDDLRDGWACALAEEAFAADGYDDQEHRETVTAFWPLQLDALADRRENDA